MGKTNKEIISEYFDLVINGKDVDSIPNYFSADYRAKTGPYVGTGCNIDTSVEDKVVIVAVAKGGPAHGKLQVGDEILSAEDEFSTWDSLPDLRAGSWGQGVVGTSVTLTVLRNGEVVEVPLTRGLVEGFDFTLDEVIDNWKHWLTKECPDMEEKILHIAAEGDIVMVFSESKGTVTEFNRQAVWNSCYVCRMKDGKIVEDWGTGPTLPYYTQLGFKLERPAG